jgi:hypothetical protein
MVFSLHGSLHQSKSPQPVFTPNSFRIRSTVSTYNDFSVIFSICIVYRVRMFENFVKKNACICNKVRKKERNLRREGEMLS